MQSGVFSQICGLAQEFYVLNYEQLGFKVDGKHCYSSFKFFLNRLRISLLLICLLNIDKLLITNYNMIPKKRTIVKNLRLVSMIILWLLLCFVCNDRTMSYLRKVSGFQRFLLYNKVYFHLLQTKVEAGLDRCDASLWSSYGASRETPVWDL